ncbi:MAG: PAS domain S-box protein [Phormidesmis sp.]
MTSSQAHPVSTASSQIVSGPIISSQVDPLIVSDAQSLPFFTLASDIMCILDQTGRCCQVNPAFSEGLGYSQQAFQGQSLASIAHPDDWEKHNQEIAQRIAEPSAAKFTCRYQHQSGDYHWLTWSVSVVEAPGIEVVAEADSKQKLLYCVARDITEQRADSKKQREIAQAKYAALKESEQKTLSHAKQAERDAQMYADAVRNMQVGLYIWQLEEESQLEKPQSEEPQSEEPQLRKPKQLPTLRLIGTNPAAGEFTGVDASKLIGSTLSEIFPALKETDIPETYAQVARTGQPQILGEVIYGDDRVDQGTFMVKAFPLNHYRVGIAFENITERKRYENAHREQEEQLRVIFDQAGVGMARLSPGGQWIQVNQKLCDLLEYSQGDLLQKNFTEVTHPDDIIQDTTVRQQMISAEKTQITYEKRYITRSNSILWASVTISTVRDLNGKLRYFIATTEDITDRKLFNLELQKQKLELQKQKNDLLTVNMMLTSTMTQLKERNQELDQFAYVTSHDLRAPLRAINNLATWIEEDISDQLPAENKNQLQLLRSRVKRMEGLINGLLEYSRVARTHQSHERVDVRQLIDEVIDSIDPPEGFEIKLGSSLPVLEAKKVPLIQVFSNLIDNAIKHHNRSEGTIQISCEELNNFYEFTVTDDGPGIKPDYHERIFVIFQTLQARDDFEATGIGLSLVKKIVLSEGGTISVDSEIGKGATFRFRWPKEPNQGIQIST